MKIISFDVGIKNLAYVVIECDESQFNIVDWDIICLVDDKQKCNTINLIDLGKKILEHFSKRFSDMDLDKIIIENQIGNNAIRMKCVQGMMAQWFIDNNFENVEFVSSSHKLNYIANLCDVKNIFKNLKYAQKKKMAINIIKSFLTNNENYFDERIQNLFMNSKKKDDLADCFLQAYYYIKRFNIYHNNLIINTYDLKL